MTEQMDETKKQRLEEHGWKIGTVKEFLGLSPEEEAWIELRLVAPPQPQPPRPA